jgi:hypothetical protein
VPHLGRGRAPACAKALISRAQTLASALHHTEPMKTFAVATAFELLTHMLEAGTFRTA